MSFLLRWRIHINMYNEWYCCWNLTKSEFAGIIGRDRETEEWIWLLQDTLYFNWWKYEMYMSVMVMWQCVDVDVVAVVFVLFSLFLYIFSSQYYLRCVCKFTAYIVFNSWAKLYTVAHTIEHPFILKRQFWPHAHTHTHTIC